MPNKYQQNRNEGLQTLVPQRITRTVYFINNKVDTCDLEVVR